MNLFYFNKNMHLKAVCFFKRFTTTYQTTWRHIQEGFSLAEAVNGQPVTTENNF